MNRNESWQVEQDEHGRDLPINVSRRPQEEQYSGFLIVRLSGALPAEADENLLEMAKSRQMPGLATVLEQFNIPTARRVVRSLAPAAIQNLEADTLGRASDPQTTGGPSPGLAAYWRID